MTASTEPRNKLLPCPFCGSHMVSQSIGQTGDGKPWHYIECEECAATADPEFWNRRAPASQARVPLSEEQVRKNKTIRLMNAASGLSIGMLMGLVRAIERAQDEAQGFPQEKQG